MGFCILWIENNEIKSVEENNLFDARDKIQELRQKGYTPVIVSGNRISVDEFLARIKRIFS